MSFVQDWFNIIIEEHCLRFAFLFSNRSKVLQLLTVRWIDFQPLQHSTLARSWTIPISYLSHAAGFESSYPGEKCREGVSRPKGVNGE